MSSSPVQEPELRQILLVRAIEETQADRFNAADQVAAAVAALSATTDVDVLAQRAAHLCRRLPALLRVWLRSGGLPAWLMIWVFLGCLAAGLSANYLGASGQFHIVYNPVSVLLLWNVLVYGLLVFNASRPRRVARHFDSQSVPEPLAPEVAETTRPSALRRAPWWLRRFLPRLWQRYLAMRHGVAQSQRDWQRWQVLGQRYLELYIDRAGALLGAQMRLLLHLAALALSLGAVMGLYLNGLFAEYHAVWRSTFVADPNTVHFVVNLLLGPAALLLDGQLLGPAAIAQLMSSSGAPASAWLHKLALMSLLLVLLPRIGRVWSARRQMGRARRELSLPLDDAYFTQTLEHTQQRHVRRIREGLAEEIREEIVVLAMSLGKFVQLHLFDARIQPHLQQFRDKGGRIDALEQAIREDAQAFEPELQRAIKAEQDAFAQRTQARLYAMLGREIAVQQGSALAAANAPAWHVGDDLGNAVAGDVSAAIGVVVATAVSAAVGSISGGIGKGIGIAIISHLLGASGPLGLLIGALIGLAGGGAVYVMGRDRLKGKVKSWRIPAAVARMALRESKLSQARTSIGEAVQEQIHAELAPAVETITNTLLAQLPRSLVTGP
jgi:hypothetical protein